MPWRYWETRRVFYNAVLMAVAVGWVITYMAATFVLSS